MRIWLLFLVACTSSPPFTAAKPPADVCALLTTADAQMILPNAGTGVAQQTPPDTADYWTRDCKWSSGGGPDFELVVFGALTQTGLTDIRYAAHSGMNTTPVSGLGDEATYWEQGTSDNGLWAMKGSLSVDITAYFFSPFPTADQMKPLVAKALSQL